MDRIKAARVSEVRYWLATHPEMGERIELWAPAVDKHYYRLVESKQEARHEHA